MRPRLQKERKKETVMKNSVFFIIDEVASCKQSRTDNMLDTKEIEDLVS